MPGDAPTAPSAIAILTIIDQRSDEQRTAKLAAKVDRFAELYLEQSWNRGIRRAIRLRPLTFALVGGGEENADAFAGASRDLAADMEAKLFGDDAGLGGFSTVLNGLAPAQADTPENAAEPTSDNQGAPTDQDTPAAPRSTKKKPSVRQRLCFQGVYVTPRDALIFNELVFRHPARTGETLHPGPVGKSADLETEIILLDHASEQIAAAKATGRATMVTCPVSYASLTEPARLRPYRTALAQLDSAIGDAICLRVMGGPPDVGRRDVAALTSVAKDYVRLVEWAVEDQAFSPRCFAGVHVHSIALRLPAAEPERSATLQRFCAQADAIHELAIQTSVFGLKTASELKRCVAAGVRYVSGPAVSAPRTSPRPAMRAKLDDLPLGATPVSAGVRQPAA